MNEQCITRMSSKPVIILFELPEPLLTGELDQRYTVLQYSVEPDSAGYYSCLCVKPAGLPEWPKGSDCKSDGDAYRGSNP